MRQFVLDGEAVVLGIDGISDFNALHSRKQNHEVQLCAFDLLALDGEDLRKLPLSMRKTNLERLLRSRPDEAIQLEAKSVDSYYSRGLAYFHREDYDHS